MSGLAELAQRHARLQEISGIMTAMKSLSLVETHKLAKFIGYQQRMLANIEAAVANFMTNRTELRDQTTASAAILVLVGSERGFCGNFNERLVQALGELPAHYAGASLLVVGQRLGTRLAGDARVAAYLEGATVTEEVPAVLERLLDAAQPLRATPLQHASIFLCLAHNALGEPQLTRLLPLMPLPAVPQHRDAPQLQMTAQAFYQELLDQYLLAALSGELYTSLAAESRRRLAHMQNAIDRLDDTLARLALHRNILRQERIVEEIEVLLSSDLALSQHPSS